LAYSLELPDPASLVVELELVSLLVSLLLLSLLLVSLLLLSLLALWLLLLLAPDESSELEVLRLSFMYQPEPLNIMPTGCSTRLMGPPPQFSHMVKGSAVIDCSLSNRVLQFLHSYSYIGIFIVPFGVSCCSKVNYSLSRAGKQPRGSTHSLASTPTQTPSPGQGKGLY
jgi:hypothetical protein